MHPYIMQAVFVDKNSPMLFTRRYDLTDRPYRSRLERKYVEKVSPYFLKEIVDSMKAFVIVVREVYKIKANCWCWSQLAEV